MFTLRQQLPKCLPLRISKSLICVLKASQDEIVNHDTIIQFAPYLQILIHKYCYGHHTI